MSMIYPHWDSECDILEVTSESFTFRKYYDDPDCTKLSTKLLGRYQKNSKAMIKDNIPPQELIVHPFNLKKKGVELNDILLNCMHYLELGYAEVVSEEVELNHDYNPEFWQQEYEAQAKAIAMAEKDGYHIF